MVSTKFCKVCGSEKPLTEYYVHSSARDGHQAMCKSCMRAYARVQKRKWRERMRAEKKEMIAVQMKEIVGKREREPLAKCDKCPSRSICAARVRRGLWALCERPDKADYMRAERMGIPI